MNGEAQLEVFSSMPVPQAVFKNAIPATIAMIMVLVYNLADTFFIGQTHNALMVTAISIASPMFMIYMAIGTIFGIGGTSMISRAMGEGRHEYAAKISAFCWWGCLFVGFAFSACIWLFTDQILGLIGASPDTWEMVRQYLIIVAFGGPFLMIATSFSNIVRAEGKSTEAMAGTVLGNVLNIILDPILILVFGMDIAGAAIATAFSAFLGAVYYFIYFAKGKSMLSIRMKDFTLKDKIATGTLSIGFPASVGTMLMTVVSIVTNQQMAQFGDMAIAGIGVGLKVMQITGTIAQGIGQGIQPLLGFCIGAKLGERYKKVIRFSNIFSFLSSLALTVVCFGFAGAIVSAFLQEPSAYAYGVQFSRILVLSAPFLGIFYIYVNAMQAMGAALPSLGINIARQVIIYLPLLFLLKAAMGAVGIVWAQPVADTISCLLAVALHQVIYNRISKAK